MAIKIRTVMTYPLTGAVDFAITFEYLARKFVTVTLIGKDRKELVLNQDYRFTTKTQITTTRAWTAADGYYSIEIRRLTSATDRLVDFADGSILRAYDLNIAQIQTLHVAEEARDLTADTIGVNNDGHLDARGRKIVNVADATEAGDAVSFGQLKTMGQNSWQARNEALQFRNEAETFRNQAEGLKNESGTNATNTYKWRNEAEGFRNEAEQFKNTSGQYSASAGVSAGNAKDSEDEARRIAADIKAAALIGYVTRRSFEKGFNVTAWNEVLLWEEDGEYYRWDGTLPKNVPAGSTPESTGGVGLGAWLSVGDASLRSEVYSNMAWVSPEMYGALKEESAADTQAVIDAFITAKTMGLAVKLSRIYKCDQNISVTNFYSDVFGVSMATSGIKFAAGCGLVIDNSGTTVVRKPVGLRNFTIKATGQLQGVALTFLGTGGTAYARQLIVRDLDVSNDAGTPSSFATVFKLSRAGQTVFDGVNVSGGGTSAPSARMGCIFDLSSTKNLNVVNGSFQNFDTFMLAHDDTEGVVVFSSHIIAGRRGVVSENNVGNLFQITNNHFNTSLSAVELGDLSNNGGNHSVITDNFCIVFNGIPEDATTPYVGFKSCAQYGTYDNNEVLLTGFTKDVTHTLFTSNATGTRTARYNIVSNPRVNNCTRGIHMRAGTQSNHVSNVQRVGVTLANAIVDEGSNNRSWMFDVDNNAFMTKAIKLCNPGVAETQQIRFYSSTDSSVPTGILRVSGGTAGVTGSGTGEFTPETFVVKQIRPAAANAYACGASSFPWSGGFTQTAFTITSDADCKSDPLLMTDAILDAAEEVQFVQYKYLDRIEEKGVDGARWHFGAIAQRYVEAFERHGLDAHRFGFICYDEWGDTPAIIDEETGEVITPAVEAGSRYGIRYEEMLVMEAAVQRRNHERCMTKIKELESRLSALEIK